MLCSETSSASSAALKLQDGQIGDNRMLFEEVALAAPKRHSHLHRDRDELAYSVKTPATKQAACCSYTPTEAGKFLDQKLARPAGAAQMRRRLGPSD